LGGSIMTAAQRHPVAVVAAFFAALVALILLTAINPGLAFAIALVIGGVLAVIALRGSGPWIADIPETHPDALGSLDVEHLSPPTT
jgi:prepilin signal peptidase PulO-like enzyme (type II secretory pathway)